MLSLSNVAQVGKNPLMNINWELVSHCQFNCSYCYFKPHKSSTDYSTVAKLVLKKLQTIPEKFKITLIGGEPSLHPDFHHLIGELHQIENSQSIAIVTNFEKPLTFWTNLLEYKDKVKLVISLHVEYPQDFLIEKIQELQNSFKIDLVFNVHPDLKYLPRMKELANLLDSLTNENVVTSFMRLHKVEQKSEEYFNYPEDIELFFEEQNKKLQKKNRFETVAVLQDGQWQQIPKFAFVDQRANSFEGWNCELKAFIIHYDGHVSLPCRNEKKHILTTDFRGKDLICPHRLCVCDDYWEFPKTKRESL